MTFGEKLEKLQADRGVSDREIARRVGVSANTIANWTAGAPLASIVFVESSSQSAPLGVWFGTGPGSAGAVANGVEVASYAATTPTPTLFTASVPGGPIITPGEQVWVGFTSTPGLVVSFNTPPSGGLKPAVQLLGPTAVPEPGPLVLAGVLGLAALAVARRQGFAPEWNWPGNWPSNGRRMAPPRSASK